jgi:hypothetical protein
MPIVINGDPKGNNFLYCNGNAVVIRDINVRDRFDYNVIYCMAGNFGEVFSLANSV